MKRFFCGMNLLCEQIWYACSDLAVSHKTRCIPCSGIFLSFDYEHYSCGHSNFALWKIIYHMYYIWNDLQNVFLNVSLYLQLLFHSHYIKKIECDQSFQEDPASLVQNVQSFGDFWDLCYLQNFYGMYNSCVLFLRLHGC